MRRERGRRAGDPHPLLCGGELFLIGLSVGSAALGVAGLKNHQPRGRVGEHRDGRPPGYCGSGDGDGGFRGGHPVNFPPTRELRAA